MKLQIKDSVNEFVRLYQAAGDNLIKASQLLVQLVSTDEGAFEKIIAACPGTTYDSLFSLWQCGRIGLDPRKMIANPKAARAVLSLPPPIAKEVIKSGLPVVPKPGKLAQLKPFETLKARDVRIAVAHGKIRTNEEQSQAIQNAQHIEVVRYKIDEEGRVTFYRKASFTAGELMEIAKEAAQASIRSLTKLSNQVK